MKDNLEATIEIQRVEVERLRVLLKAMADEWSTPHGVRIDTVLAARAALASKPAPGAGAEREQGQIDGLMYIDGWITSHLVGPKVEAYNAAMADIRCHIRAGVERIQLGKGMESTSQLASAPPPVQPVPTAGEGESK